MPQSSWITHVKKYAAENNVSYKEALSKASASYKKGSGICSSRNRTEDYIPEDELRSPRPMEQNRNNREIEPLQNERLTPQQLVARAIRQIERQQQQEAINQMNLPNMPRGRGKGKKKKNSYASRLAHCATNGLPGTN